MELLGADLFAHSAFQTLRGFGMSASRDDAVIVELRIEQLERLIRVECREHIGDKDILRAFILIHTVSARCAGHESKPAHDPCDLADRLVLVLGERPEILHI